MGDAKVGETEELSEDGSMDGDSLRPPLPSGLQRDSSTWMAAPREFVKKAREEVFERSDHRRRRMYE